MQVTGYINGGTAFRKKFQINATVANAGIPMLSSTGSEAGLDLPGTTNAADMVGINFDTATYVTAQQTDGTSAERVVLVDMRSDMVIKAFLSGGSSESTALSQFTVVTATTDGLDVTAGDFMGTSLDKGVVWGYTGVNAGDQRKITSVSTLAATVTVAFDGDHQVGDIFLAAPFWPVDDNSETVTLTAAFFQIDASVAISTAAAEFNIIQVVGLDQSREGNTKSHVLLVPDDHVLNKLS